MIKLYKKDTLGKTRVLYISTSGPMLIQLSGLLDGGQVKHEKICKGKNIGKSNETTPEQQAILEMNSKVAEKLTEGYFRTIEEAESVAVVLPMLAKSYGDEKHKIDWSNPVYCQPKLDGNRCLAFIKDGAVTLMSRQGKIIDTLPHINKALSSLTQVIILDGEVYAHGKSFQENMRLIKKYRPGETEQVKYHVYDMVSPLGFSERIARSCITNCPEVVRVPTYLIQNEEELKAYHAQFIQEGYEGTIIRHGNEGYKVNGRSSNLLKYKDFKDIALPILDIEPAEQRPEWGVPVFELNGKQFRTGTRLSHDERKEFLANKANYIGKTAEIRFFEYSEEGTPRFPIFCGIRLDK